MKKPNSKGYIVHDFIYVIFTSKCKDGDRLVVDGFGDGAEGMGVAINE